ncbi:odorant receptor 22c-like [Belonocnema kinseyi]|uniref:odorant receptor 22c-like n=1 Tax=Belonocnema kinseyi TaxID=2817044 RepID=UPI00143CF14C|nr:odorant receptor 22c-like [Belonocnema kinseyi]
MDIEYIPYYRINKYLLLTIGQWPYQKKIQKFLITSFLYIALISLLVPELAGLAKYWGDMDITIECIPPIIINFASTSLITNCIYNMDKMELIVSKINKDWITWSSGSELEILHKTAAQGHKFSVVYATYVFFTTLLYLGLPVVPQLTNLILPLNESRPRKTLFPTDYYINVENNFYYILIHGYISTVVCALIIVSVDTFFIVVIQHACGIYKILGFKLKTLLNNAGNDSINNNDKLQDDIDVEIKFWVRNHRSIMKFVNDICDFFSTCFFLTLGFNMLIMSVTGVQTVMKLDQLFEAMRFGTFTICQMFHLCYLSMPCQQLIDLSVGISDSIYDGYWYKLSTGSQKLLLMIMRRSAIPCTFTAGTLYTYSIQNFAAVVQKSMSYFTVLSSIR